MHTRGSNNRYRWICEDSAERRDGFCRVRPIDLRGRLTRYARREAAAEEGIVPPKCQRDTQQSEAREERLKGKQGDGRCRYWKVERRTRRRRGLTSETELIRGGRSSQETDGRATALVIQSRKGKDVTRRARRGSLGHILMQLVCVRGQYRSDDDERCTAQN